ncbi:YheC/YheD family protein [Cytobacillus sp. FJAT-54145]|uniref:YheC/YheD family protein n=1 Tax=Cytobacillus spartinae TaxID=3299023 RepID=A0ABW6K7N9_9BACI
MLTLGFITLNLSSELTYFTEIAKRAKKFNIKCYRFIPSQMNPLTEKIVGEHFSDDDRWVRSEFEIPEILYDRCFYGDDSHSKQCMAIVNWFKSRADIKFLGHGLPNKLDLYEVLVHSKLSPYLPQTHKVHSPEQVIKTLQTTNPIIIKPVTGSQGYGVYFIEKLKNEFKVRTDKKGKQVSRTFQDAPKLLAWLDTLLAKRTFLIQPYLPLTNEKDQPFDIRSLLQKNKDGRWTVVGKGVRMGEKGGILSNLSVGATVENYEEWIGATTLYSKNYVNEEIDFILTNLPTILENEFLPLFELGVDIGLAKNGSLWILDVNSKPGRKVLLTDQPHLRDSLYEAPLIYAKSLSQADIKERRSNNHEKTLSD